MGKFDNYEFRCSALGKIVSKSGKLTDGVKTYLEDLFIGETYSTKKDAYGKALDKGRFCEEEGITMLSNTLLKGQLVLKNKERKRNGFIHGECDVVKNGTVYDIKNALDLFSFGKAELTWEYEWQLVGYYWLWECKKAILFYCLNNMPMPMLEEEKRMLFYKDKWKYLSFEDEQYLKDCEALEALHNYDKMPIYEKFKHWEVNVTGEKLETLKDAIIQARKFLNELQGRHEIFIKTNRHIVESAS
ncbi:hypothetical protein [Polluticaenibacter yanchengensis]|uniref:YqaJ viral recombinase domain-containing protein n=1 Tax=Polluticaenibacter yanchengensis TaxID=3014562 RepID=A0ABT4UK18_9BACT|nr:hypothetical protein [Chitinophagaceae bacterium LY-5]